MIEDTHNADFDEIERLKKNLTSEKSPNTPSQKSIISQTLDILMKRFKGMTDHITKRLAAVFWDPAQRKAMQAPIRESVRERLAQSQTKADAYNEQRRAERARQPKEKHQDMPQK